jgi:hypothetical protein
MRRAAVVAASAASGAAASAASAACGQPIPGYGRPGSGVTNHRTLSFAFTVKTATPETAAGYEYYADVLRITGNLTSALISNFNRRTRKQFQHTFPHLRVSNSFGFLLPNHTQAVSFVYISVLVLNPRP